MKYVLLLPVAVFLSACGPAGSSYRVALPALPPAWLETLGVPEWRLEWINPEGVRQSQALRADAAPEIQVLTEWATPVTAYPFWPNRGIPPGLMRPAGGIAPFDLAGEQIRLSWRAGVEAALYQELAVQNASADGSQRHPRHFNWPRFRELLASAENETIRKDPWTADWKKIAEKIAQSGFDRRRITPMPRKLRQIPVSFTGIWIGVSPFADPVYQDADLTLPVCATPETYFSAAGVLRCTENAWILMPYPAGN